MPAGSPFDEEEDAAPAMLAQSRGGDNDIAFSVSDLSAALKRHVESGFGHVRVRGEISGFKRAASGHLYFGLKDEGARLDAVMWKTQGARLPFRAEDGLDVVVTGRLTTYPGRSNYQIIAEKMELAGEGALLALLEKTKKRLAAEGVFDQGRKYTIPYLPRVIGVVTSPTGAVIRDILHRLDDRFPTQVLVWPVPVQGDGAATKIAAAIRGFSALTDGGAIPRPDLIIVARGGGSIEDLWAFNEEIVVRAVADCTIPLISAVGHETDTTLIDFVSDKRAPTPTAAAEMAVPVRRDLATLIDGFAVRANRSMARQLGLHQDRLTTASHRLPGLDRLLAPFRQRFDDRAGRLGPALRTEVRVARQRFDRPSQALGQVAQRNIAHQRNRLRTTAAMVRPVLLHQRIRHGHERLDALWRVARSLDPRLLLTKGYAMVRSRDGHVLTSAASARSAQHLLLSFADGEVAADVVNAAGNATSPPRDRKVTTPRSSSAASGTNQGSLFD